MDDVLIQPRRIPGDPDLGHPVILAILDPYLELLRKELKLKKSSAKRLRFPSVTHYQTRIEGKDISLIGPTLGAPQAVLALERIVAMGARRVMAFGCCGSLQTELRVGQLVVPTDALSEEGTSAHYPLPEGVKAEPDPAMVRCLLDKCGEKKIRALTGKVWTTDALFRETREKTRRYSAMGLLAVEMEMAALFTVAAYRKVQFGGLMVVSDELAGPKWKTGFLNPFFWLASKKSARLVVEACCAL